LSTADPNFHQRYSCRINDKIEGPFDLVELAGLLREGVIDGDTPVCFEGTEAWGALRDRTEYRSAQDIPIEIIARHLHEKERAGLFAQAPRTNSFSFVWVIFVGAMAFIGLMVFWPQPQPAAAPPPPAPPAVVQADWPVTTGDHFSVKCPTSLKLVKPTRSNVVSYRGFVEGATFGVDTLTLPGRSDADYQRVVDEIQSIFLERQRHATAQHTTTISGAGYQGQEVSFDVVVDTSNESGKVRFVFGEGNIVTIWVIARPDEFSPQEMDRFLTSLEVR
jgi:hypothetical protein